MKIVIFCGGVGTRFWPLSRKSLPKQFDKTIFNHKSTFEMAVERVKEIVPSSDIFVSTNINFASFIKDQFKDIKKENLIVEPEVRDLAPAVGLFTHILYNNFDPDEPFTIVWSDHLVEKPQIFAEMIRHAQKEIQNKTAGIVFYGHTPRFPNENLGWISYKDTLSTNPHFSVHKFTSWKYRPNKEDAEDLFNSKEAAWNLGYWTTTPRFLVEKYQTLAEDMHKNLEAISKTYKTPKFEKTLKEVYPTLEKVSFDDKIVNFIKPYEAIVLVSDIGWSDPGTLYALKEALQKRQKDNVLMGNCYNLDSTDCLVFNRNNNVLTTTLGLQGMIVVVTNDVVFVCPKQSVPEIKSLVKSLEERGLDKYL